MRSRITRAAPPLERLRALNTCLIAPHLTPGWRKAFFVHGGAIRAIRPLPPGPGARLEIKAGLAIARITPPQRGPLTSGQAEDMLLLDGFVRRPPPELAVLSITQVRAETGACDRRRHVVVRPAVIFVGSW